MAALQEFAHQLQVAVEFEYGDPASPTYSRYVDWDSDLTIGGDSYTSEKRLEVQLGADRGDFNVPQATVVLPVEDAFTTQLAKGEPHSPVFVTILERGVTVGGGSTIVTTLFTGRLAETIRNYQNRSDLIALRCRDYRALLNKPLGLQCNAQCAWVFTGTGCELSAVGLSQTGTMTSISRLTATITGLTQPAFFVGGTTEGYWHRGYVERDGLRIGIRDWRSGNPTTFHLVKPAPSSWSGQSVTAFPGCDKTIKTCRERWDNEEHFGGFGIEMPAYKPLFENPG